MQEDSDIVLAKLAKNHQFNLEEQQRNSWIKEIEILKKILKINALDGYCLNTLFREWGKELMSF
jgi:hypothetical protein